jgi:prepilin-type N-terminal cleavage/methylation domain-containing protein
MNAQHRTQGLTLIETLVAITILVIGIATISPVFLSNLNINRNSESRDGAISAARQTFEQLRQVDLRVKAAGTEETFADVSMGGRAYSVKAKYCTITTYCNGGSRHVLLEVSLSGKKVYNVDTVYTQLDDSFR